MTGIWAEGKLPDSAVRQWNVARQVSARRVKSVVSIMTKPPTNESLDVL